MDILLIINAIVLGIMQGIFEWLPISSQGNILGILSFFGLNPTDALRLAIFLHIGTLFSAIVYYRKEIKEIIKWKNNDKKELGKFVFVATIATAITAIPSYLIIEEIVNYNIAIIFFALSLMLFITGILQLKKKHKIDGKLNKRNAIFAGLGQGFSALPGISRSGITTSVLLFRGFDAEKSFHLSFLMSIPAVLFAQIGYGALKGFTIGPLEIISLLVAFIVGLISIDILIKTARKVNFAYVCFGLGLIYLIAIFLI
jgi:undecaprenyl-diphosphatase